MSQPNLSCYVSKSKSLQKILIILTFIWIIIVVNVHERLTSTTRTQSAFLHFIRGQKPVTFNNKDAENVPIPQVTVEAANCKALIENNTLEIKRALRFMNTTKKKILGKRYYIEATKNCSEFLRRRRYITRALSQQEASFKIAFSIMIYKDVEQFERMLRAIYRPQNYYCIHVDAKASGLYMRAVQKILACFANVFIASKLVQVRWGKISALQPDVVCMKDLWKRFKDWKYFINLTGQEFPLRTNNELVAILRSFNGTADVKNSGLFKDLKDEESRLRYKFIRGVKTKVRLPSLPYESELAMTKGACHVALPRSFVTYMVKSWLAGDFLKWLRVTRIPDETFLPTLNYSPELNIPGSYRGKRPSFSRYKNWQIGNKTVPCHGKTVRDICINGVGDLAQVTRQPEFFVNKFHLRFQPLALDCMEEWFYNRTIEYYKERKVFDVSPYVYV